MTARKRTPIPLGGIYWQFQCRPSWVNELLPLSKCQRMLGKVKTLGEERLRVYLMKRHKVKNRKMSTGRFPSRPLYAKYGLFKVPATAG